MERSYLIQQRLASIVLILVLAIYFLSILPTQAHAVPLTSATLRFDRLQVSIANVRVLVKFRPNDVTSLTKVRIDFDDNFVVDNTPSNIDTSSSGLPSECTAATVTGNEASAYAAGDVVDFDVTGVGSTSTTYCFYITTGITNPSSAATEYTSIVSTRTGSGELGATSVVNYFATSDQITVSAVVPPSFTFALGANSTSFTANLSTSTIRSTTGVTGTVITNAANGWTAYLRSANAALDSVLASDSIPTQGSIDNAVTTLVNGSKYYQLDVDETSDAQTNGAIDAEYNGGSSEGGTFNSSDLEEIASGTGSTSSYIFTLVGKATISGITKASSDYTDTWTVVAAGNF